MPLFLIQRLETVTEHCLPQNHAVLELYLIDFSILGLFVSLVFARVLAGFGIAAPVGVALNAKVVKDIPHIHILARLHVE